MYLTIAYLKDGNAKQKYVYQVLQQLGIMNDFSCYSPVLCGTIPLAIDHDHSDLDIIMTVKDFHVFTDEVKEAYGQMEGFRVKLYNVRNIPTVKVNFYYHNLAFEIFAQDKPVIEQNAYLHMIIEAKLLSLFPDSRSKVIAYKKQGYHTEAAFCKVLDLSGNDPFSTLLDYGREKNWVM
ncbi:DUF4269 domain-containing protein [Amphibacillus jilinensis]|uniref:DUF4269 domain-containing protein n=1 Tax=Amphibacillus jilinensis TaxID=1216008 RepID=UPI00030DBB93|nr:DUF4269 domain-containing protein [Amphibacillus jilinensis]